MSNAGAAPHAKIDFMSIRNQGQLDKLRAIGKIVRLALDRAAAAVRPGVTTRELDEVGASVLAAHSAEGVRVSRGALHQHQR